MLVWVRRAAFAPCAMARWLTPPRPRHNLPCLATMHNEHHISSSLPRVALIESRPGRFPASRVPGRRESHRPATPSPPPLSPRHAPRQPACLLDPTACHHLRHHPSPQGESGTTPLYSCGVGRDVQHRHKQRKRNLPEPTPPSGKRSSRCGFLLRGVEVVCNTAGCTVP